MKTSVRYPHARFARSLRALALHSLLVLLSTLIVVLPVPFRPSTARADAFQVTTDSESFNFPAQSAANDEAMADGAAANALKHRTSPVSASGAFSTSLSIDLPPGRSGMTPSLGLSYTSDSNRKDSPVGAGWSFGAPSISRDTSEGFPPTRRASGKVVFDDDRTQFVGASGRLVRSTANEGMTRVSGSLLFVPERERSPVRYEFVPSEDRWIEHLPSGVKRYYGAAGTVTARVIHELGTHEWLLLKELDPDGNSIEYDYHHLTGPMGQWRPLDWQRAQTEPVLKSVRWGKNERAGIEHMFRVETVTRPYAGQLDMLNGHTVLQSQITTIQVYGPAVGGGPERLYWDYALELTQSTDSFRHLLRSVTRRGYSADTGAIQTTQTTRYSYSENGAASFLAAGGSAASVDAASRDAYSELQSLPGGDRELFRSGFQIDVSYGPLGQRPTLDAAQVADLIQQRPMDALSPEYRGAGYRFEDFDADGDTDVLYHPTGLGTPASRWLQHKSYLRSSSGFARIARDRDSAAGTISGIAGTLLATSFADVDGDSDPDAVAFPLFWSSPTIAGPGLIPTYTANYYSTQVPFSLAQIDSLDDVARKLLLLDILREDAEFGSKPAVCVPSSSTITTVNGTLMNLYGAPPIGSGGLTLPGWVPPPRLDAPDLVGTTDPEGNLRHGDPMLDIRYRIGLKLGMCRYRPWFVRVLPLPAARDTRLIKLAYNTSRGTAPAGQNTCPEDPNTCPTIRGWPRSATKKALWGMKAAAVNLNCWSQNKHPICNINYASGKGPVDAAWKVLLEPKPTPGAPYLVWNASFNQQSDFQAPMADVNADGRADIVLLKSMTTFASITGGVYTNFTPGVFLANGTGFSSSRDNAAGIAFDVTALFPTLNWEAIASRRIYDSSVRPSLSSLRPGPSAQLAPSVLDLLPSLQRSEIEGVLRAYRDLPPDDEQAATSLRDAVLSAFDRGISAQYPSPVASLQNLALEILRTLNGSWFGGLITLPPNLFPSLDLDVTDVLVPVNERVFVSFPAIGEALRRMGRSDLLVPYENFARILLPALGGLGLADLLPPDPASTDFTSSALDIFNSGKNTTCESNDKDSSCDRLMTYPISLNFNAFPFDVNGDGLPDMVAAHRPLSLTPPESEEEEDSSKPEPLPTRSCANGHQVFLNRGYRWEDFAEATRGATLAIAATRTRIDEETVFTTQEGWSSPSVLHQVGMGAVARVDALGLLNQRDRSCEGFPLYEADNGGLIGSPTAYGQAPTVPGLPFDTSIPPAFRGLPMAAATFSDVNADGLTDIVFAAVVQAELARPNDPKTLNQQIFLNTPRGFKLVASNTGLATLNDNLALAPNNPWRGLPSDFYATQYLRKRGATLGTQDRARLVDIDNDGLLDVVYRGECTNLVVSQNDCSTAQWRKNLRKVPDLLTRVDESAGAWTEVDYVSANSDAGRAVALRSKPGAVPPTGMMVVSEIRSGAQPIATPWPNVGGETAQRIKLSYDNYTREEGSKRALGFETVTAIFGQEPACNLSSGNCATTCGFANGKTSCAFVDIASSTTTYDVARTVAGTSVAHPLRGSARSVRSLDLTNSASEMVTTYDYLVSALGSAARIRAGRETTKTREGSLWMFFASLPSSLDSLGYAQVVTSGRATEQGAIVTSGPELQITRTTYAHRANEWRLGRENTVTTEGDRVNGSSGARTRGTLSKTGTTYDPAGRVASHSVLQDAGRNDCSSGEQWSVTSFPRYTAAGLPEQIVDNGTTVTLQYDALSLYVAQRSTKVPVSPSSPNGPTLAEQATYDLRFGSITSTTDPNGNTTDISYDARGRLLTKRGPDDSLLERNVYSDEPGKPWTVTTETFTTESSSFNTWTAFDGYGRVLASNREVSSTSAIRVARNRYDGLGRLSASYQPAALDVQPSYALQNLTIEATALPTRATYDGFDRVLTQTLTDGRVTRNLYDHQTVSNVVHARTTTTNPRGFNAVSLYNTRGSLVSLERRNANNAAALSYSYEYDGAARMVAVRDSVGTRRIAFDEGGRLRSATLAYRAGQTPRLQQYCYDARGKLTTATTPAGREVIIQRDSLGRASQIDVDYVRQRNGKPVAETTSASFVYDCSAAEGSLGKLCERTDPAATTHIAYDEFARADYYETSLDEAIADTLPPGIANRYSTSLTFGLAGQLQTATVQGLGAPTRTVSYTHDLLARTTAMRVSDGQTARQLVKNATYDGFQRLKNVTLGNDVVSAWDFDLASRRLSAHRMQRGSSTFAELRYPLANYDANGNLGREQRYANNDLVSEKVHTYDALDQLETSILRVGTVERKNERFTYSQGNLTTVVGGGRTDTYAYTEAQNTQAVRTVTGTGYTRNLTYDADGWVSRDVETRPNPSGPATLTERSLTFDASGCMREAVVRQGLVNGAAQTTTTRNLCGLGAARAYRETTFPDARVERVYYLPDGSELRPEQNLFVMQLPVATSTVATLAWSLSTGQIVHEESGYIHSDVRGSVVARTRLDASDVTIADSKAEYGAWGDTVAYSGVSVPRYQYTNEEPDPGTGYYYFGARPYDPTLRRWLAPDPLIMGDLAKDAQVGTQLNLYSYVGNNPVMLTDRTGLLGDTPAGWERGVEQAMANWAAKDPGNMLAMGIVGASAGLAIVLLPEAAVGSLVGAIQIGEKVIDGVNVIVATVDLAMNPNLQSAAGLGLAVGDLVGGMSPVGDANSGVVASKSMGGGDAPSTATPKSTPSNSSKAGSLPIPPRGPGSVPKADRDQKRVWTPAERAAKRDAQGGKCANNCGTEIDDKNSRGHHKVRHADGGKTDDENHAEVCTDCHLKIHSSQEE